MPCDFMVRRNQTPEERRAEVDRAVEDLARKLVSRDVTVQLSPEGSIAFEGWETTEREGVTDACAFLRLEAQGSMALQEAIATAETVSGRGLNREAIAAGVHSHDGGRTWGVD